MSRIIQAIAIAVILLAVPATAKAAHAGSHVAFEQPGDFAPNHVCRAECGYVWVGREWVWYPDRGWVLCDVYRRQCHTVCRRVRPR